jgi:hypothetical protein
MKPNMKIDDTYTNLLSGVPNSISYCYCNGADKDCEDCNGTGHIFLPFICLFPDCEEGFCTLDELNEHMMKEHNAQELTFQ